jgi:signal transduction histidine kinase
MVRNLDMKTPALYAAGVGLALAAFFLGRAAGAGARLLPVTFDRAEWALLVVSFGLLASFAVDAFRSTRKQGRVNAASINLTDRERGEERLRALFARLQSIREEERTRIARDLHDELGQLLTALKLQLCSLEKRAARKGNGILEHLVASSSLIDQTLATVRRIAFELRPSTLDQLGLVPTLREEIRRFEGRTGIRCNARLPEQLPDLGPERTTALYRIFQEALTNVSRHAGASQVAVRLEVSPFRITLECEDDGRGFDASFAESPLALGLAGMVERARALEGEVRFQRGPERGTIVTASIPLAPGVRS